ncbi:dehydrogenase E1 and transketolase domain-containing protein 1 [Dacryopinax primogenitus]|uniref:Dehydrogenase E1 and transketolase domain-containing protein 1 n=1 Tax=Dacryopinax primogenitus (strain DJM 731) TaxID=1858805 RepID=M5GDF4_DACPD|nr:dehydrogenase E1 and transketolase domain-containing protein 1 [Dacryopinax primogenitus]EJU02343.1 dehydrogenase E1 and transketolase domain-containing protein 1 [Dacryopinax primogenitus]
MFLRRSLAKFRRNGLLTSRRGYQDESFGYRKPRPFEVDDYTEHQLANRTLNAALLRYADSVRLHGHRAASIDPLDLLERDPVAALDPERYGLVHREKEYDVDGIVFGLGGKEARGMVSLGEMEEWLRSVYVGRIAYEFMHSPSKAARLWFAKHLESAPSAPLPAEHKLRIAKLLSESEVFEHFLQTKFPNLKRYGGEGAESMIAGLDGLFAVGAAAGVEHIILCMPHRGRLALLTGLLEYSPAALFHKIKGGSEVPEELGATADVISHLTAAPSLVYQGAAKSIKVTMLPNPSHLEAVNPVAMGKTRAKQYSLLRDLFSGADPADCKLGDKVMCVQLHGDGAFTGQGVVMESLGLSDLPHYTSGGSVHIVVNNNIGYTTPSTSARSSLYCSDVAKMIAAPVLHVNGDHPEDVVRAIQTAFTYRQHFRKDIVVDLITYRRWGHNELDEPAYTQPLMYEKIRSRKSVPKLYEEKLEAEGVLDASGVNDLRSAYKDNLEKELTESATYTPVADHLQEQWSSMVWPGSAEAVRDPETGISEETLKQVAQASVAIPEGFEIHPRLQRHVKQRLESVDSGKGIDFGTAEAMAFGSLMLEGYNVRISGQDVGRGTFSHRHAMLVDQKTERVVVPLNMSLGEGQGMLELANSSLSEFGVLGFEWGVSIDSPRLLPIWESQFGDFFNGAQIIIDTFVSSGESKWLRQSGLVMLLPHGLDGAGPEHSSARIERFLQLTNDPYQKESFNPNMHVINVTTSAQYFHLLRRQMKRNYRKPLIVASPKALLRAPAASSSLAEMTSGTKFQPVLADPSISDPASVKRLILLTGKFYYILARERDQRKLSSDVAIVRIEELAPFPFDAVKDVLSAYSNAELVWAQEEPKNQGAYPHVAPRIASILAELPTGSKEMKYVGRKESPVPAVAVGTWHAKEAKQLLDEALAGL